MATNDEIPTGTANRTKFPYTKGIPEYIQDIVFIQNFRYYLPEEELPYFDWWVEEESGYTAEYPLKVITPHFIDMPTLTNDDIQVLLTIISAQSFKGSEVEVVAALKAKLTAMRQPEVVVPTKDGHET